MVDGRQRGPGRAIFREGAVRATRVVDGASGLAGPRGRGGTVAAGRPRAGARDRRVHGSGGCRRLPPTVGRETQPTSWGIRQHHQAPIILGTGTPLFKAGKSVPLTQSSVRVSQRATHL